MRLSDRNLRAGMAGEDVAELHQELSARGYQIPDSEGTDHICGVVTAGAVAHFQKAHGLWDTAVVDANTAAMFARARRQASGETQMVPIVRPRRLPDGATSVPVP